MYCIYADIYNAKISVSNVSWQLSSHCFLKLLNSDHIFPTEALSSPVARLFLSTP